MAFDLLFECERRHHKAAPVRALFGGERSKVKRNSGFHNGYYATGPLSALELCAAAPPPQRTAAEAFSKPVEALQDALGVLNDLATARSIAVLVGDTRELTRLHSSEPRGKCLREA
jgi:hypothetical protein